MIETKDDVLGFIDNIDVRCLGNYRVGFSHQLKKMYDCGEITDNHILIGLEKAVINTAKSIVNIPEQRFYLQIIDRVSNGPEILAYALLQGKISWSKLNISGYNEKSFCEKHYNEGLFDKLKDEILTPLEPDASDCEHPSEYFF